MCKPCKIEWWSEQPPEKKEKKAKQDKAWWIANKSRKAWLDQKANAKKRGIPFYFPYECWLKWWGDDISKRGCHSGELVMARFGDAGAYVMANVYKATCNHNSGVRW